LVDSGGGQLDINVPGGVTIQEEGVDLANTPHTTLNFIGNTIVTADAGGGVASITVTPVIFRDEGISITGTPHTDVNFIGSGVSVANAGGNQVQVSIPGITYRDTNVDVAGAPHTIANFTGGGVEAVNSGSGVVSIDIPGITFQEESVNLSGSPHTVLNFIGSTATAANVGGGVVNVTVRTPQVVIAVIGAATDTTQIPFDNSLPLITEGTQIVSATIAPQSTLNRIEVTLSFSWEHTDVSRGLAIPIFRGSTLVGMAVDSYGDAGVGGNPDDNLRNVSYTFVDSPNTTSNTTYSVRVGANDTGTWRINNKANGNNFGGALIGASTFVLREILD
jgi:hypothetical protein